MKSYKKTIKRLSALLGVLLFVVAFSLAVVRNTSASFYASNLMDDGIFDNSNSMTASQIDSWLNTNFGSSSCISTDHGFSAPQPIGYSPTGPSSTGGFSYGSNVSAGTVIYDASKAYGLNPQVILVTLEKEEGLLDGTGYYGCSTTAYTQALGYNCPDGGSVYQYSGFELYSINGVAVTSTSPGGTCVNNAATAGFSRQVVVAAWQLKFDQERSEGNVNWNVQLSNFPNSGDVWDNSDDPPSCYPFLMTQGTFERSTSSSYCPSGSSIPGNQPVYYDGLATIDGSTIQLDNGATAALYDYTPHFSGNEHFDSLFEQYFGGIYASPYVASYYSESSYPQLSQGQQTTVYISYQNLGTQTWYDDNSLSSAPAGTDPVHLATGNPLNVASPFSSGWPSSNRPALNFADVYLSDGITLTSNQNIVEPGQVVKFSFIVTDPQYLNAGTYQEYFQPVVEGTTGLFNNPGTFLNISVSPTQSVSVYSQSSNPTVAPLTKSSAFLMLTNTGNVPLYDSTSLNSAPAGTYPVHLATSNPINSTSSFSQDWPSTSRASYNFAAVYDSDGTTLAPNQHVAQPGQIIKFSFDFIPPQQFSAGSYTQYLQPILEGTPTGYFPNLSINWTITVSSAAVISVTNNSSNLNLSSNQPGTVSITINNVGNVSTDSTGYITSSSALFQAPTWLSSSEVMAVPQGLSPGQSSTLDIPIVSPGTSGTLLFNCDFSDSGSILEKAYNTTCQSTISVAAATYTLQYVTEASSPSITYGQTANVSFLYKNTGNQPWYDDSSIAGATWRNPSLVHLATAHSLNRISGFDNGWPAPNRPATLFSAVLNSNGTAASNQHIVQPGQIAEFSFNISPESWVGVGVTREFFMPIVEGSPNGYFNDPWTFLDINVLPYTYSASYSSESDPTLSPGQQAVVYIVYKNTGTGTWYDNNSIASAPSNVNTYPVHLSTSNPLNRLSSFSATWPSSNRADVNFSTVYDTNGYTPSGNNDIVKPGEYVKFQFTVSVPSGESPGTYNEYFQPIAEGTTSGLFNNSWTFLTINVT